MNDVNFEIVLEEARVVRQIFAWVGRDRCSIGEVQRRLNAASEQTRTGKTVWDRATIWGFLKNPAYNGEAASSSPARLTHSSGCELGMAAVNISCAPVRVSFHTGWTNKLSAVSP
jgi:hypothetical protein